MKTEYYEQFKQSIKDAIFDQLYLHLEALDTLNEQIERIAIHSKNLERLQKNHEWMGFVGELENKRVRTNARMLWIVKTFRQYENHQEPFDQKVWAYEILAGLEQIRLEFSTIFRLLKKRRQKMLEGMKKQERFLMQLEQSTRLQLGSLPFPKPDGALIKVRASLIGQIDQLYYRLGDAMEELGCE